MDKNPFLHRLMKPVKEDIFHSSAYGRSQNGSSMGAASTGSFNNRVKTEQDRTMIKGYGNSSIMGTTMGNGPRAKTFTPAVKNGASLGSKAVPPRNPGISR